jgi:hypothetical protein
MSKIKRYNTFQTMGGMYNDPDGHYLDGQQVIPGTKVTVMEWVEKGEEIIELLYAILGKATAMNTVETKRKVKGALVLPSMKLIELMEDLNPEDRP